MKTGCSYSDTDLLINWFLTSVQNGVQFLGILWKNSPFLSISLLVKLKTVILSISGYSSVTSTVRRKLVVTLLSLAATVVSSFNLEKLPFSVHP